MPEPDRCADCLRELRPAIERAFALKLWRELVQELADMGGMVSADGTLRALRRRIETRTGLDLSHEARP